MNELSRRKMLAASAATVATGSAALGSTAQPVVGYRHVTFHNFIDGFTVDGLERYVSGIQKVAREPLVVGLMLSRNLQPRSAAFPYDWMMSLDHRGLEERLQFYKDPVLSDFVRNVWQGMYSKRVIVDVCQPIFRKVTDSQGIGFRRTLAFSYKESSTESERARLQAQLAALLRQPAVKNAMSGPSHLPKNVDMPFSWLAMIDFADQGTGEKFLTSADYQDFQKNLDLAADDQVNFDAKDIRDVTTLVTI